jgi:glycerol-1-phosphate dehydrogenase [NAD(P)+]
LNREEYKCFAPGSGGHQHAGETNLASPLALALQDASTTREVIVQAGALQVLPDLARRLAPGAQLLVVADALTWQAAGQTVQDAFGAAGLTGAAPRIWSAHPRLKPHAETAQALAGELRAGDVVPIAVGSGVVSDLVKYAAQLAGRPYFSVPTAASMDGYAASGAALLEHGFKRTLACDPPLAVVADPQVLAHAPGRMAAWGYGDLAGKLVAGADWVLADALDVEPLNAGPFALVQDHLADWLAAPERLAQHDPQALGDLLSGLLVSGFAMQAHGNSRPASGSDHQFSHLWEMENLQVQGEPAAHGACVGVGTVAMLALYEWLLARPLDELPDPLAAQHPLADASAEIEASLGRGEIASAAVREMEHKRALGPRAARVQRFVATWPTLRPRLAQRLLPASELQRRLRAVGGACHPEDLGLTVAQLARDYRRARLIRRRYTLLDLLEDAGWLDLAVAQLFAADGFWGRQSRTRPAPALAGP